MPLIYITGTSGSGKSTVLEELKKQGFETHGVDEEGFADWIDRETGETIPFPHDDVDVDLHDWYQKHRWVLSQGRIGELKKQSDKAKEYIFLGGVAEGENKVERFFDHVIYLAVDEATLKQRINDRKDNHFGKTDEEMADILKWLKDNDNKYRNSSALVVDARKPLDEVVNDILHEGIGFSQIGRDSLKAYVQTIQKLIEHDEQFDIIAAAGDSGQLAARITEEVYTLLGKPVPPKLVAPIYRHADEAETILFDNKVLASQFASWKNKPLTNALFVDDEIGSGNAARGILDLLLELSPSVQSLTIVAEDGSFDCPPEIRGVQTRFIPTRTRVPGVYNAISYTVPWKFQEPLKTALADEPDLNDKQVMCTLLNLPTKEFNDGQPEFNNRLIKQAQDAIPNFTELQKEYQEYFAATIKGCL